MPRPGSSAGNTAKSGYPQNVADALYALKTDADALQATQTAEQATSRNLAVEQKLFALGDANHLAVLQAEQTWQQAEIALVQAQVTRYGDTVALFQALGGGWWNNADAFAKP